MPDLFDLETEEPEAPPELTQEGKDAAAAEAREAKEAETQATLDKFKAFASVVEQTNLQPRQEEQPRQEQLTPAQRKEIGEKLQELSLTDPAKYAEVMLNQATQQAYQQIARDAQPLIEATTKRFIKDFKIERAADDKFFKEVSPKFDEEVKDLTSQALLNMGEAAREKELTRRWKAAKADVLDSKVEKAQSRAPFGSAGGGTSVGPSPGRGEKVKVVTLEDTDKRRILSNCGGDVDRAKKLIASIEYGE
jgi:hypothetical protein